MPDIYQHLKMGGVLFDSKKGIYYHLIGSLVNVEAYPRQGNRIKKSGINALKNSKMC